MKSPLLLVLVASLAIGFASCKKNTEGCTDPNALNYNPDAQEDNGNCVYPVSGCTDPEAHNFNPDADLDNGNCIYAGCTNPQADNYNPVATVEDGSCIISGCTDPTADNYNPAANEDDGTCIDARLKFANTYAVTSDCNFPFDLGSPTEFAFDDIASGDTLWIDPLSANGDVAYAFVDGIDIVVPQQTYGFFLQRTYSGLGSIDTTTNVVTITYEWSVPFVGDGVCTAEYQVQ